MCISKLLKVFLVNGLILSSMQAADKKQFSDAVNNQSLLSTTPSEAAQSGSLRSIMAFLSIGADVNTRNDSGKTLLHLAAEYGHKPLVEYLLTVEGIEINAVAAEGDFEGYTALHFAVLNNELDIARLLCRAKAKRDIKNSNGSTVYDLAREKSFFYISRLLEDFGVGVQYFEEALIISASHKDLL